MKKILFSLFVLASGLSFGQTFSVATNEATVKFNYISEKTTGSINRVEANLNIDLTNMSSATVSGKAYLKSFTTGNKMRDKHLRSDDFFDAENFPVMTFESSDVVMDGDNMYANGRLTIRGVTKDVAFQVTEGQGNMKFMTTIYGDDFGVAIKKGREKSKITVTVSVPVQ